MNARQRRWQRRHPEPDLWDLYREVISAPLQMSLTRDWRVAIEVPFATSLDAIFAGTGIPEALLGTSNATRCTTEMMRYQDRKYGWCRSE